MVGEIEWIGSDDPELPEPEPVPRGRGIGLGAAVLVAVAVLLSVPHPTDPISGHGTSKPVAVAGAAQPRPDQQLELIRSLAGTAHHSGDLVRSGSAQGACPLVRMSTSPSATTVAAVRSALMGYTLLDVARTLDQYTALCSLTVRAADPAGTVLVVQVVAPPSGLPKAPYPVQEIDSGPDGMRSILATNATAINGWSVTVGTDGPAADRPALGVLLSLAENPVLQW
ncbi:hypothetical protein [Jatrophihabitans sp.]|uniref:hypothetical protein n=1 Tax=Jatrophihabitans sp. TaxID=1932789 RepID=UPI0030C77834|nr:hypothetical protein [Jatrophihabitans sp.]